MLPRFLVLAAAGALASACALAAQSEDPDWKELPSAPPPLVSSGLIDIEVPRSSLRFGVDPASVRIGSDGIVRYVVVARSSSGTVNALYEGVRCETGEMRVYARHNADTGWVPAKGDWVRMQNVPNSRHTLAIAQSGLCSGRAPNSSVERIVRDLRRPADQRFETY
jgi:hypothetical protein